MRSGLKILMWTGGIISIGTITYFSVRQFQKSAIRKELDIIYKDPTNENAAGGLDKLLVNEVFDKRTFQRSGKATISKIEARERAKEVWDNYSTWFQSDVNSIIGAFDNLGHLHDVSKIAYEFHQSYGEELLAVLNIALGSVNSKNSILIAKIELLPKN